MLRFAKQAMNAVEFMDMNPATSTSKCSPSGWPTDPEAKAAVRAWSSSAAVAELRRDDAMGRDG